MIEPNPDWYGTYARHSALADYLELASIAGYVYAREDLADLIRDSGWTNRLRERMHDTSQDGYVDGDLAAENDEASLRAGETIELLVERQEMLETRYPFDLDDRLRLEFRGRSDQTDPYLAILAISVAHATKLDTPVKPFRAFEQTIVDLLNEYEWPTANLGSRERSGGGFAEVLREACAEVGLQARPEESTYRTFAHDEGTDTVSNLWPSDSRPGGVQVVGQVTCARSDQWDRKMSEPKPKQWSRWLGTYLLPASFLAVPHHVEHSSRTYLLQRNEADLLDRLRIASVKKGISAAEGRILQDVLDAGVNRP